MILWNVMDSSNSAQTKQYAALVFDLDGTLTVSKQSLAQDMSDLLCALLSSGKTVGIISGGAFAQFENQFLGNFQCDQTLWSKLYLMPTSGASMFTWEDGTWKQQYAHTISKDEYKRVCDAYDTIFTHTSFPRPVARWGDQIEYRDSGITFSALGQKTPVEEKKKWKEDGGDAKRFEMVRLLEPLLPEYHIRIGGMTSVDISQKGIDKAYGLEQFWKVSGHNVSDTLFVGDALYEGGNDNAVVRTGVDTLAVDGPSDVLRLCKIK